MRGSCWSGYLFAWGPVGLDDRSNFGVSWMRIVGVGLLVSSRERVGAGWLGVASRWFSGKKRCKSRSLRDGNQNDDSSYNSRSSASRRMTNEEETGNGNGKDKSRSLRDDNQKDNSSGNSSGNSDGNCNGKSARSALFTFAGPGAFGGGYGYLVVLRTRTVAMGSRALAGSWMSRPSPLGVSLRSL